jgi:hypothetical protein
MTTTCVYVFCRSYNMGMFCSPQLRNSKLRVVREQLMTPCCVYDLVGDGLAVNMSGQHVCVLLVQFSLLPLCGGILASDMAYGVLRQGFDPGLQVFLSQQQGCIPVAAQTLLFTRLDARA